MRLPFNISETKFDPTSSRVKFSFTSPELHQNIEISLDGNDTSIDALLDAFQRFLGALGVCLPDNIVLGFVEETDDEDDDDDQDGNDSDQPKSKKPNK